MVSALGALILLTVIYGAVLVGCGKRVTGTQTENQPPVVNFVNTPPDSLKVSKNTIVYWYGTDPDGLVKEYRYVVVTKVELTNIFGDLPDTTLAMRYRDEVLPQLEEHKWTRVFVEKDNPSTTDTVRLTADMRAPVTNYVVQYIFLQAIDDLGLKSVPVWKVLSRNDNPPNTIIRIFGPPENLGSQRTPFLNSVLRGGAITGVRVTWAGESPNYTSQTEAPPFAVRWKVFGPYDSLDLKALKDNFVKKAFVTFDGVVYVIEQNRDVVLRHYDTTYPGGVIRIDSTSDKTRMRIDTVTKRNDYGILDSLFLVYDSSFVGNAQYYRLLDSSASDDRTGWVSAGPSVFYNLFRRSPSDSTRQRVFVLWATCRDDAYLEDPVPAFRDVHVLDPRMEKDVLILDFSAPANNDNKYVRINGPKVDSLDIDAIPRGDSARMYWGRLIRKWRPEIIYDSDSDYLYVARMDEAKALQLLVKYKILILYNDDVKSSGISDGINPSPLGASIYTAIDAGVNAWLTMRCPAMGNLATPGASFVPLDNQYKRYWGVAGMVFSGWSALAIDAIKTDAAPGPVRIEDFAGASSLDPTKLPDLVVDTAQLHGRYYWGFGPKGDPIWDLPLTWRSEAACLPEVDWTRRIAGTEPLYLYKSRFGVDAIPFLNTSYEGAPVAHRFSTSFYRTAHFNFTPLSIRDDQMQVVADTILNWLYVPQATSSAIRYPDAVIKMSAEQVRQNYEYRQSVMQNGAGWQR